MKGLLKSSLSLLLAITIIFSSAYVGLSEVDVGGVELKGIDLKSFLKMNLFENLSVKSNAASESDLTFRLNSDGNSYSVTDCDESASGELVIPSTYNGKPVTSIGGDAFEYRSSLTSIIIPDSVISIGNYAFVECYGLTSVILGNSVTSIGADAFAFCKSLESITIPNSVTSIGKYAFRGCRNLESITIPNSVTSIGEKVFRGCDSLSSIIVDSANENYVSVEGVLFNKDKTVLLKYPAGKTGASYIIPDSVTSIGEGAFESCTSLMSIEIPDGATNIGEGAFESCTSLTSIEIPDGATNIGEGAFFNCNSLTSITIPDGVTSIGYETFAGCAFTSITIPDSVTSIGDEAFLGCLYLNSITIPDSVTSIGQEAFYYCTSLASITIPDSVTSIGDYAFMECYGLTSVIIGNSVTSIGEMAFAYCPGLTSITIPDSVTNISEETFSNCENLTSITIPDSVTSIGDYAFSGCESLKAIYYTGTEEEWGKITIGDQDDCFYNATIHYNQHEHIYGDWVIDVAPTCTDDGSKSHHCKFCDDKADVTTITATGHIYEITDALSTHPHTINYKCSNCNATKTEAPVVSDCIECSFTITAIDSSSYKFVSYIGTKTDLVVPATYKNRAVTTIANGCFKNNKALTSVKLEHGITTIGSLAFMNCTALETVYIPASVTSIGANAFYGFTGTIYCCKNSTAHEYAVANKLNYVLLSLQETAETKIDYENFIISTSVENCGDIAEILGFSETVLVLPVASYMQGNIELYGTGTIISVFDGDEYIGDFTLIVNGDTNGDSVCDALDCFEIERTANGNGALTGAYAMAADSNADNMVDITDYQAIVNKALAS